MAKEDASKEIKSALADFLAEMERIELQYRAIVAKIKQPKGQKNND